MKRFLSLTTLLILTACAAPITATPTAVPSNTPPPTSTATATPTPTLTPTATSTPIITPSPTTFPFAEVQQNQAGYPITMDMRGHLMVRVPAGTFMMGLQPEQVSWLCDQWGIEETECLEDLFYFDYQIHTVTLTYSFWMDVYEVTNAQYQQCVDAGICVEPEHPRTVQKGVPYFRHPDYLDYPYIDARWEEAQQYCELWRGGRLPTEAEWEYAARGEDGRLWPWGNELPDPDKAVYTPLGLAPAFEDYTPVDTHMEYASPFGLVNMAGNIDEWVSDWYGPYPEGHVVDPLGPPSGTEKIRRGGASFHGQDVLLTAYRRHKPLDYPSGKAGIRCVIDE